jgi:Nucleotidyl transferase AbiEii toxin, Type IV TA system
MTREAPLHLLLSIAAVLDELQQPYALVGGLAVSVRAEVRFTRDVDLAISTVSDDDTELLVQKLRAKQYTIAAVVEQEAVHRLATVRLNSRHGTIVDLLAASCGIEPEIVERAEAVDIGNQLIPVARAEELLAMKVLSTSPKRKQDAMDALALLQHNPGLNLPEVFRNLQLIQHRGFHRQQDLRKKLDLILLEWQQQSGEM